MATRKHYWQKCKWWLVPAALLIPLVAYYWNAGTKVAVGTVERRNLVSEVEATGEIEPRDKVVLYSKAAGKIETVAVKAGDVVREGEVLARLDTVELQLEAREAEAHYRVLVAQLAGLTGAVHEQARARLEEAQASYRAAERSYERAKQLYARGSIAKVELEAAELAWQQARSTLTVAEQELRKLEKREGTEVKALQAQVDEARAQLELAEARLQSAVITAPITGTVFFRYVEPGSYVNPAEPLFMLGSREQMVVKVYVLQDDIGQVRKGQAVRLSGEILGKREIQGRVDYIAPAAEKITSSLGVEQTRVLTKIVPASQGELKPGFKVDVAIITARRQQALAIPATALIESASGPQVLVVRKDTAVLKRVETGLSTGEYVEIVRGLRAGEKVILEPGKVKPGERVKARA
ncbi:MAG: efflux RND transporter periplasmic adaptor subunit [Syntrophomonadaceae bacterium]|nr:efflux RND transporter periplasmic adaptor subunit [Syntrophomonadaceae bacterium]